MRSYDLLVFDADGTVRETTVEGQFFPTKPGEWRIRAVVKERLAGIDWKAVGFGVASNQGGVFKGMLTEGMARQLLIEMVKEAMPPDTFDPRTFLPHIANGFIQLCPHDPRGVCSCRKPMPGMLTRIMAFYDARPERTLFVGNSDSDLKAAQNAGCMYLDEQVFFAGSEP
jgi:D-glycero-D-manno-heptose 1,7-bisphosphate phosphatase